MDRWLAAVEADRRRCRWQPRSPTTGPTTSPTAANVPGVEMPACPAETVLRARRCRPVSALRARRPADDTANDRVACQLRPLDRADYGFLGGCAFTDDQWATLQEVFPDGVCDYASPAGARVPPRPGCATATRAGDVGLRRTEPAPGAGRLRDGLVEPVLPRAAASVGGFWSPAALASRNQARGQTRPTPTSGWLPRAPRGRGGTPGRWRGSSRSHRSGSPRRTPSTSRVATSAASGRGGRRGQLGVQHAAVAGEGAAAPRQGHHHVVGHHARQRHQRVGADPSAVEEQVGCTATESNGPSR